MLKCKGCYYYDEKKVYCRRNGNFNSLKGHIVCPNYNTRGERCVVCKERIYSNVVDLPTGTYHERCVSYED